MEQRQRGLATYDVISSDVHDGASRAGSSAHDPCGDFCDPCQPGSPRKLLYDLFRGHSEPFQTGEPRNLFHHRFDVAEGFNDNLPEFDKLFPVFLARQLWQECTGRVAQLLERPVVVVPRVQVLHEPDRVSEVHDLHDRARLAHPALQEHVCKDEALQAFSVLGVIPRTAVLVEQHEEQVAVYEVVQRRHDDIDAVKVHGLVVVVLVDGSCQLLFVIVGRGDTDVDKLGRGLVAGPARVDLQGVLQPREVERGQVRAVEATSEPQGVVESHVGVAVRAVPGRLPHQRRPRDHDHGGLAAQVGHPDVGNLTQDPAVLPQDVKVVPSVAPDGDDLRGRRGQGRCVRTVVRVGTRQRIVVLCVDELGLEGVDRLYQQALDLVRVRRVRVVVRDVQGKVDVRSFEQAGVLLRDRVVLDPRDQLLHVIRHDVAALVHEFHLGLDPLFLQEREDGGVVLTNEHRDVSLWRPTVEHDLGGPLGGDGGGDLGRGQAMRVFRHRQDPFERDAHVRDQRQLALRTQLVGTRAIDHRARDGAR